jgi:hypothetical protein
MGTKGEAFPVPTLSHSGTPTLSTPTGTVLEILLGNITPCVVSPLPKTQRPSGSGETILYVGIGGIDIFI